MCEVIWNTWRTCERSWCQWMRLHALKILHFRSLSFLLSVSVVVLWLSSLIDARTLPGSSRLEFESSFIPSSYSCFMRVLSVSSDLFDLSIHFISYLFISLIFLLFLLPYTFYFLDVVDNMPAHFRWGAGPLAKKNSSTHLWRQRSRDQDDHKGKKPHNETCFQDPQSCPWLVIRSNQLGPKNPYQIHWHQKPTRRHTDKGKFHTWWMESSIVFIQHQPFQFHQLSWSDVEKNSRRCRWRNQSRWWIWYHDTV